MKRGASIKVGINSKQSHHAISQLMKLDKLRSMENKEPKQGKHVFAVYKSKDGKLNISNTMYHVTEEDEAKSDFRESFVALWVDGPSFWKD